MKFLAFFGVLFAASPAFADPVITPAIVIALVDAGIASFATAIVIAQIATFVITTAIGLAVSMLLAPRPPSLPKPADGHTPFEQAIPETQHAVGYIRMSGAFVLFEEKNNILYMCIAIKEGKWSELDYLMLDDIIVPLTSLDVNGWYDSGDTEKPFGIGNLVRLIFHDGSPVASGDPNPFQPVIDALPGFLDDDFRPDGVTALCVICKAVRPQDFSKYYPRGRPSPSIVGYSSNIWDLRDNTQDPDNEDTWKYSNNPVIARIWYECFCPQGPLYDYNEFIRNKRDVIIEQADICDELVTQRVGDPLPRYGVNFWFRAGLDRSAIRATIMASCDGWDFVFGDRSQIMRVGKYEAPTIILTDLDIEGYDVDSGAKASEFFNELTVKYTSIEQKFGEVAAPPWKDEESISKLGRRSQSVDYWGVQNQNQARRLGKRVMQKMQAPARGTITTNLRTFRMLLSGVRFVRIQSETIGLFSDVVIEIENQTTDIMKMQRTINFHIVNPNILDAFDAATEEGEPPPVAEAPETQPAPMPTGVDAQAEASLMSETSYGVRLAVIWDDQERDDLIYNVRYRKTGTDVWTEQLVTAPLVSGGFVRMFTNYVTIDSDYEVQVQSSSGAYTSDWTVSEIVNTSTEDVAPAVPTSIMAFDGTGQAVIEWRNPLTTNFFVARIYRAATGAAFNTASDISGAIPGSIGGVASYTDTAVSPGVYDYWVVAENSAGAQSLPDGPSTATVS